MASVIQQHPPSTYYTPSNELQFATPSNTTAVVPPPLERQDSMATVDMHIPGAWVGTNPPTPVPIQEDMANLSKQLQTLPGTVQGYIPSREQAAQHASNVKEMVAAAVPASVANAATNILPSSVQPTMSPTAADAAPPVPPTGEHPISTTTNTVKHKDPSVPETDTAATGSSLMDKAAALLPAGALDAAAAILPSSMNPTANPTAADAQPPAESRDIPATGVETEKAVTNEEKPAESSWTEKIVPAGALAAAGAYLPTTLNPFSKADNEGGPTPNGTHEGLNAPLPKIPSSSDTALPTSTASMHSDPQRVFGSTVSQDSDVQKALANSKNPENYKVDMSPVEAVTEPTTATINDTKTASGTIGDEASIIDSTRAVGGTTPIPTPAAESSDKREKIAGVLGGGVVGAFAVDHRLKNQKEEAAAAPNNSSRLIETNDSFQHVITPATPFAGEHEGELWQKKGASEGVSKLDTTKKQRKERSGSVSAGEASPSSPNKTGVFSGIRKLTKKKQRSKSRGHSRDVSMDDNKPEEVISPATHQASLDSQDSNSSGPGVSPSSPTKKQHKVLHKDPPTAHQPTVNTDIAGESADPAPKAANNGAQSTSTPSALANPFSPSAPPASPSKASIRDKLKGEFMVVSGTLTRDSGLKEAGKKMKEGTL